MVLSERPAATAFRRPSRWAAGRWLQRHPTIVDTGLALVVLVVALSSSLRPDHSPSAMAPHRAMDAGGVLLLLGASLPLLLRRRHPVAVFGAVFAAFAAYQVAGYREGAAIVAVGVSIYTVASLRPPHVSLRVLALAEAVTVPLTWLQWVRAPHEVNVVGAMVSSMVTIALPWVFGENIRHRRSSYAEMIERTERAEQEREQQSRRAVSDERARIARELHDIVAHAMSVMVVQAGGARRVLTDRPGQAAEALANIETTGRSALTDMRRLLGVLREDDADRVQLAPQPGAHDLPALVRSFEDAGLDVTITVDGSLDGLPTGVDLTAYRLVQEALTNTFKHAGPARVSVAVARLPSRLQIVVADDGRGDAAPLPPSPGHGLIGMRERVALYGGGLEAGPAPGGGWRVDAVVPLAEAPAGSPAVPPPSVPRAPAPRDAKGRQAPGSSAAPTPMPS